MRLQSIALRCNHGPRDVLDLLDDIRSETRGRPPDVAIAALADLQHGVVARRQITALGLGSGAIQHRLASGRLHRVFRGVFAVGRSQLTGRGRWMAAVLTCGEGAMLSHRSAAALWGFAASGASSIDVTAPGARRRSRTGLALHGGLVHPEDCASREGIPVTSVARTLLDLAEAVGPTRLERAVEEAERTGLFDLHDVERLCERSPGRRGLKSFRVALDRSGPFPETRSELERGFITLCREAKLPLPGINRLVEGLEVDAVWEHGRLIVELDGYAFHGTRRAFERDRARDARLLLAGYQVLRVTARRLCDEPESVAATIRRLLAVPAGNPSDVLEVSDGMR